MKDKRGYRTLLRFYALALFPPGTSSTPIAMSYHAPSFSFFSMFSPFVSASVYPSPRAFTLWRCSRPAQSRALSLRHPGFQSPAAWEGDITKVIPQD